MADEKTKKAKKQEKPKRKTLTLWIGEDILRRLDQARSVLQARSTRGTSVTRGEAARVAINWLLIELLDEEAHPENPADRATNEILHLIHDLSDNYQFPSCKDVVQAAQEAKLPLDQAPIFKQQEG